MDFKYTKLKTTFGFKANLHLSGNIDLEVHNKTSNLIPNNLYKNLDFAPKIKPNKSKHISPFRLEAKGFRNLKRNTKNIFLLENNIYYISCPENTELKELCDFSCSNNTKNLISNKVFKEDLDQNKFSLDCNNKETNIEKSSIKTLNEQLFGNENSYDDKKANNNNKKTKFIIPNKNSDTENSDKTDVTTSNNNNNNNNNNNSFKKIKINFMKKSSAGNIGSNKKPNILDKLKLNFYRTTNLINRMHSDDSITDFINDKIKETNDDFSN